MLITVLIVLGLMAGSFVNALVWRVRKQEEKPEQASQYSIVKGRSMCPHCSHTLGVLELIPLVSWLILRGRCRYCSQPISLQYPLVELIAAAVFVSSYLLWPVHLSGGTWILFGTWLICSVGLLALAVFDSRWMLLPNKIIYPTLVAAVVGRALFIISSAPHPVHSLLLWAGSLAVASGIFWALFKLSHGKLIGYGDVRLGLITGTLLAAPDLSLAMIFFASLLGCVVALPSLIRGQRTLAAKLPYGPFLIVATAFVLLFGASIITWYKNLLIS